MSEIPYFEIEQYGGEMLVKFDGREWRENIDIGDLKYDLRQNVFSRYVGEQNVPRLQHALKSEVAGYLTKEIREGELFKLLDKWTTKSAMRSERIRREDEEQKIKDK